MQDSSRQQCLQLLLYSFTYENVTRRQHYQADLERSLARGMWDPPMWGLGSCELGCQAHLQ